ncbi:MAG TPA: hypothetical protein VIF15_20605 [Polyangiaceae bacterium]|jgi:hypothetical protein
MKTAIASLALPLALLAGTAPAAGAEGPHDVETDHIDAFDEDGPRTLAVLVDPLAVVLGTFAVEGDVVLGPSVALGVEGEAMSLGGTTAYGGSLGLPIFPQGIAFHGLYLHPRLAWARATGAAASADVAGVGGSIGWEWTLRLGLTVRTGLGAMVERLAAGDATAASPLVGVRPLLDGTVGWTF